MDNVIVNSRPSLGAKEWRHSGNGVVVILFSPYPPLPFFLIFIIRLYDFADSKA